MLINRSLSRFIAPARALRRPGHLHLGPLLLLGGLILCADGLWIQAKAWLAQQLIANAWAQTVAGQTASKPWPWADTWPVGRLQAPAQAVDLYVLDGAHGSALAFGPGRLHGTVDPGRAGLSIIGGHRDTHFRFLRDLQLGDELRASAADGRWRRYRVTGLTIVDAGREPLQALADETRLLLVTCYPFDRLNAGGELRYVVSAIAADQWRDAAAPDKWRLGNAVAHEHQPDGRE